MLTAITRRVSPCIENCNLTFLARHPIDIAKACQQQRAYEDCLRRLGVRVVSLPPEPELPDAVFVEDTAVVVKELAVVAKMGGAKRQLEVPSLTIVLSSYRPLKFLNHSSTLEGGDVVHVGRTLYVGVSGRTNREGVMQLSEILKPYDYQVRPVEVRGCLHLSTGCSYAGPDTILANPDWVDTSQFEGLDVLAVPPTEPWAANTLFINGVTVVGGAYPKTRELLEGRGLKTESVDISELEKAEAGLTCLRLIFDSDDPKEHYEG
ncbi:MAG TPA: arginine deiminase family protein [Blastocatellia bacterium]|nr:arginine deiminase family protein [Blastocatellia bacterium]